MELRASSATALLAAFLLAGCAAVGLARLEPGRSTEADVRQALGEPARVYAAADGSRQLAFPHGPEGPADLHGVHRGRRPPGPAWTRCSPTSSSPRISPGTTKAEEVERLVGPPWRMQRLSRTSRQVAWDYVLRDTWDYMVDFAVMVDRDGIVTEKVHARRVAGRLGIRRQVAQGRRRHAEGAQGGIGHAERLQDSRNGEHHERAAGHAPRHGPRRQGNAPGR